MALMHGKVGDIYWDPGGVDTNCDHGQAWDLDAIHEAADITSMQDTWRTFTGGRKDWTASVTCLLDTTGADIPLDPGAPKGFSEAAALELYFLWDNVTPKYRAVYGTALCTGHAYAMSGDGIPTITYSFQGDGQLQWHSSELAEPTY